jgi:nicotinate-nucleotide adenylyltransferase
MTKIALFGTSSDPPTLAHYAILEWLSTHYDMVAVWTSDNPFKSHFCHLQDRISMLKLMIQDLHNQNYCNINYYSQLSHLRSLITVKNAKEVFEKNSTFFLVIGGDLITQIPHWYKCKELLEQVQLLIIPRVGFSLKKQDLQVLENLGAKCTISSFIPPEISSSFYRESKQNSLLTYSVKSYIDEHHLYNNCLGSDAGIITTIS